jgi:hypothetical protein
MYLAMFNKLQYSTPEQARDDDQLFASWQDHPLPFTPNHYDLIANCVELANDDQELVICKGVFAGNDIVYPVKESDWYNEEETFEEMNYVEREQSSEVVSHSEKVMLSLFMDTDDDTEIMYLGDSYGLYGASLTINRQFESRADAVEHLTESLIVLSGGKADEFTKDWIAESIQRLSNGEEADFFGGNQTYSVTIVSIS